MAQLILFFLLFSFPIYQSEIFNSFYLGIVLLFFYFFSDLGNNISNVKEIFKNKQIRGVFLFLTFIILITLVIPVIHDTNDFTMIKTLINQFIRLIVLIFFLATILDKKITSKYQIIIDVFIIQSWIQFTSFLFPKVRLFFNNFRSEYSIIKGQLEYGNIRGLSISDTSFFGLGVAFGLIFIVYIYNWSNIKPKNILVKTLLFAVLLFGGLSAARTSLIGVFIGIGIKFFSILKENKFSLKKKWRYKDILYINITALLLIITSTATYYYLLFNKIDIKPFKTFQNFAFQFIKNYRESGSFSTSSTDVLFKKMYFLPSSKTFLVGDGKYTNFDGTYYMHTDSGIMRNILFYGIIGVFMYFIYQLFFFCWERKELFFLNIGLLIYLVICQIKGETLGFLIISQEIMFYLLVINKNLKKE